MHVKRDKLWSIGEPEPRYLALPLTVGVVVVFTETV